DIPNGDIPKKWLLRRQLMVLKMEHLTGRQTTARRHAACSEVSRPKEYVEFEGLTSASNGAFLLISDAAARLQRASHTGPGFGDSCSTSCTCFVGVRRRPADVFSDRS